MQESVEIRKAVQQMYDAVGKNDPESYLSRVSKDSRLVVIGTGGGWLEGSEAIKRITQEFKEEKPMKLRSSCLRCYEEGNMGWATDLSSWTLSDGTEISLRSSAVFLLEEGQWRSIHYQLSVADQEQS